MNSNNNSVGYSISDHFGAQLYNNAVVEQLPPEGQEAISFTTRFGCVQKDTHALEENPGTVRSLMELEPKIFAAFQRFKAEGILDKVEPNETLTGKQRIIHKIAYIEYETDKALTMVKTNIVALKTLKLSFCQQSIPTVIDLYLAKNKRMKNVLTQLKKTIKEEATKSGIYALNSYDEEKARFLAMHKIADKDSLASQKNEYECTVREYEQAKLQNTENALI